VEGSEDREPVQRVDHRVVGEHGTAEGWSTVDDTMSHGIHLGRQRPEELVDRRRIVDRTRVEVRVREDPLVTEEPKAEAGRARVRDQDPHGGGSLR
jgi:hypothetical protein